MVSLERQRISDLVRMLKNLLSIQKMGHTSIVLGILNLILFLYVPTPMGDDGSQDSSIIVNVVSELLNFVPQQ